MANVMEKAERLVDIGLALLERELTLPALVWRDAAGDFAGAKNDTISIRLPAYAKARKRTLRSGTSRTRDGLTERKVDVTLDIDVYKDITLTDEELTLDIADFGRQVLNPVLSSVSRKLEEELSDFIAAQSYDLEVEFDETDPYLTAVDAREMLNKANVPQTGRRWIVGSALETAILKSDRFTKFDNIGAGAENAVREATIGRMAGFDVISSPVLDPEEGFAFHRTAYVMSSRAPVVPQGAPYGASGSNGGFAIRLVQVLDPDTINDILATDAWAGFNVVTDNGALDGDGKFEPDEENNASDLFVRAVHTPNDSS